jgi:hypothetical protein
MSVASFLDVAYGVLFSPGRLFVSVKTEGTEHRNRLLSHGLLMVVIISLLGAVYSPFTKTLDDILPQGLWGIFSGIVWWLFTAVLFAVASYSLGGTGRLQTTLTLTAFAMWPWVLLPVLMLFQESASIWGSFVAVAGQLVLWVWSGLLFLLAIKMTYTLNWPRVLLLMGVPLLMGWLALGWFTGFVSLMLRLVLS